MEKFYEARRLPWLHGPRMDHECPRMHEYNRQSIQYELWSTPMGRPLIAQSCPKFYGAKGVLLAPWATWRKQNRWLESPWSHGGPASSIALYAFYGRPIGEASCEQLSRLEIENLNIS